MFKLECQIEKQIVKVPVISLMKLKKKTDYLEKGFDKIKEDYLRLDTGRCRIAEDLIKEERENNDMKTKLTDIQCRAMNYNLIFTGFPEHRDENIEDKLRRFLYHEMKIDQRIEFNNVHRFGRRSENGKRPIVAKFVYFSDLEMVKKAGKHLKGSDYGVNEQFPPEIEQRRRRLYPIMKEERRKKAKVVLNRDKLYVNNELVNPDVYESESTHVDPRQSTSRPQKRPRVHSTPEREDTPDHR
ncbi:uncharacterized protein LOC134726146 [Mytilus trossulus]|uniref:uncharacterized protein LOC134726146 n=1 Tax=Mytilus trossulus TaxID=6551 RepID=UPI0030040CD9